jgi:small-conductance mechanosensitive channel
MVNRYKRMYKLSLKREWTKGIVAGAIAIAALGLGKAFGKIANSSTHAKLIGWAAAAVLLITGAYAIRHLARALGRGLARRRSLGAGATLRLVVTGLGYLILLFALFAVLGVSLQHLLLGAGVAGVILGIAAQQSLSNIFASIVLLFARPFAVGDDIRIRSGVVGVIDVKVMGIGLTYVTVRTDEGVLKIPNSVMLGSAIGRPHPPTAKPVEATPETPSTPSEEKLP